MGTIQTERLVKQINQNRTLPVKTELLLKAFQAKELMKKLNHNRTIPFSSKLLGKVQEPTQKFMSDRLGL